MEIGIEVYRRRNKDRKAVSLRAIAKAERMGVDVVICTTSKTAPVIIHPGDTLEQAGAIMTAVDRAAIVTMLLVYGAFILLPLALLLWGISL